MGGSSSKTDRAVIVTGATGTIGSAVLEELCDRGVRVVAVVRDGSSPGIPAVTADFSARGSVAKAVDELAGQGTTYRGAVLCAGVDSYIGADTFDPEDCQRILRINATSQLELVTSLLGRESIDRQGVFRVSLASTSLLSDPASAGLAYGMSKAALETGFRFAVEDYPDDLAVRAVRLPFVGTRMRTVVGDLPSSDPVPDEAIISPSRAAVHLCEVFGEPAEPDPVPWRVVEVGE